jgi:hypothetical protein
VHATLALFFAYFFICVAFVLHFFVVPTTLINRRNITKHGKNRNGETAESAEEEAERTGRGRFSGVGEEERGAGKVERAEEASRRWREIR